MFDRFGKTIVASIGLALSAAAALAQSPPAEIPELESEHLVNEGLVEAQILEVDIDQRTLTVRFDETKETAKLIVPANAYLARTFPNNLVREIELDELTPGDEISIQAVVVEDVIELHIISIVV